MTTPTTPLVPAVTARPSSTWTATRLVTLLFTVLEVLLLIRFTLKVFGANAEQSMISALYGITEPFVAPFRGVFTQPAGEPVFEIATILSVIFFVLVAALIVAAVRAATGRRGEATQ